MNGSLVLNREKFYHKFSIHAAAESDLLKNVQFCVCHGNDTAYTRRSYSRRLFVIIYSFKVLNA